MRNRLFNRAIGTVAASAGLALASTGVAAAQQPTTPPKPPVLAAPAETDLSVALEADRNDMKADETVSYRITVSNNGNAPAENVELRIDLDGNFVIEDVSDDSVAADNQDHAKASWSLGTVAPGETMGAEVEGHYKKAEDHSRSEATVSSSTSDPDSGNNQDREEGDIDE